MRLSFQLVNQLIDQLIYLVERVRQLRYLVGRQQTLDGDSMETISASFGLKKTLQFKLVIPYTKTVKIGSLEMYQNKN